MPQQPTTLTDRLANVIQVIQLGRKTGTLTAERNSDTNIERGTVYFVNGLMTQASAHQLSGLPAFQWLNTWGSCRFAFAPSDSVLTTKNLPSVRSSQFPMSEQESFHDTDPTLKIQAQTRSFSGTGTEHNQYRQHDLSMQKEAVSIPIQLHSREDALQRIERLNFSRLHRHLFLLVDGHRNTADLARLMGRIQVEVVALLKDLESADVVEY